MDKINLGPQTLISPLPAFLVGANVDETPNFMTVAWCGIVNSDPPMLSVSIRPRRHTYKGILQNGTFSVNVPSSRQVLEVDYCGIYSGARENKTKTCRFEVFYGKLKTAPLIRQSPVNLECKVSHELKLGSHALFIARIEESHVSEDCLTEGKPDVEKIKPLVYFHGLAGGKRTYHELSAILATRGMGKELIK